MQPLDASRLFALLGIPCLLCLDIDYKDADGNERILFDLCEFHRPKDAV